MPDIPAASLKYEDLVEKYKAFSKGQRDYYNSCVNFAFNILKQVEAQTEAPRSYTVSEDRTSWEEPYVSLMAVEGGESHKVKHPREAVNFDDEGYFHFAVYITLEHGPQSWPKNKFPVKLRCFKAADRITVEVHEQTETFSAADEDKAVSFAADHIVLAIASFLDTPVEDMVQTQKVGFGFI
ncbi:hypothetical protein [Limimaricola hongkongensis]|uniref:hypothetical protein n=1 Tax=Limimaricola hongkongensis TaxID=278132 RepID=UPI00037BA4BB|nr:hypothetical protein [Limimaricola hongkongensis]